MKNSPRIFILVGAMGLAGNAASAPPGGDVEAADALTAVEGLGEPPGTVCNEPGEPPRLAAIAPLDERTYGITDEPVMMVAIDPSMHASDLDVEATLIDPLGFVVARFQTPTATAIAGDGLLEVGLPIWELYRGKPALLRVRLRALDAGQVVASYLADSVALLPAGGLVAVLASDNAMSVWPAEAAGSPDGIAIVEDGVAPPPVYATEEDEEVEP